LYRKEDVGCMIEATTVSESLPDEVMRSEHTRFDIVVAHSVRMKIVYRR
jgi:hypothetical protein